MNAFAKDDYLVTEVMTASPQKLQLMLIEAALRTASQARLLWQNGAEEQASEKLIRCQQIVTELLCGLNPAGDAGLRAKVGGVYLFVFRTLVAAHLEKDAAKLGEAIRVLEVERETWQQVCQKLGTEARPADASYTRTSFVA